MIILGIETSCDETSAAVVQNGKKILSNIVASQVKIHAPYYGVVPEIASRKHIEWITPVVKQALKAAKLVFKAVDGLAATFRPGLIGSLLVGLCFAKALALSLNKPFIGIDHIQAHLYALHLEHDIIYPHLALIVSGGHTIIARVQNYNDITVMGATIDDACGEAFDKIAKFYDMGYPGGVAIDKLARLGNPRAFSFPHPSLHKGDHRYDVSYSGLKNAVANQLDQFWNRDYKKTKENIAAAFQKTAIDILVKRVLRAQKDTGLKCLVVGGGVAANSYLRKCLQEQKDFKVVFPSLELCTDNAAMVAGLGYHYLKDGVRSPLNLNAEARVAGFRKIYPSGKAGKK